MVSVATFALVSSIVGLMASMYLKPSPMPTSYHDEPKFTNHWYDHQGR